ncbi:DDB1- and CUL4-associated factor 12 [Entomortierella parvispora]|uniref:DDB1- and CUL4-associated factor 12 n=1 Tax=Entomortierella parvispora TaxID=205924 RepID=A0A9P3HLJ8_9FUNG|nr:DDB1- and CUL4-associated factor 12 [Entomortierella parvispora]
MISYTALETHPPRKSILGSLRKREYQTRQQQVRRGTPRRIGCPPRLYDDDSAFVHPQQVVSPQGSPEIGTSGSHRSSISAANRGVIHHPHNTSGGKRLNLGKGQGEAAAGKSLPSSSASLPPHPRLFPSRKSSSPSLSSSFNASSSSSSVHSSSQPPSQTPALHPLASSLTCNDHNLDSDAMDTSPDMPVSTSDTAMDWTAVSTPSSPPSRRLSISSSSSASTKGFVMVDHAVAGSSGGSTIASTPSVMSLGSSSSASLSTTDLNANVSRTHAALMNAHLSAAQLGGGVGRRMSSPSISTTLAPNSPYNHSPPGSSTSLSCRRTTADVMQPRPSSALSGARTWVSCSSSIPSVSSFSGSTSSAESQPSLQRRTSFVSLSQPNGAVPKKDSGKYLDGTADIVSSRMPLIVAEREYAMNGHDKIFTAKWISSDEVLMGTKCNKLFVLDTRTNRRISLGRLDESLCESQESVVSRMSELHTEYEKRLNTPIVASTRFISRSSNSRNNSGTNSSSSSISNFSMLSGSSTIGLASSLERGLRFFNAGRRSSTPSFSSATLVPFPQPGAVVTHTAATTVSNISNNTDRHPNNDLHMTTNANPNTNANTQTAAGTEISGSNHTIAATSTSAGIRSLSINPSRTLLAVGSGDPYQVTIYSVPEYEPVGMMYGHTDLVFSLTWISDTVLVSGARDGSMRVWSMASEVMATLPAVSEPVEVRFSVLKKTQEKARIRDLTLNRATGQLMTLAAEGYVKLWDRENYNSIMTLKLIHSAETVCLTSNTSANLYAVGSQSHISVVDPRSSSVVHVADSCDEGWGVRALNFKSHIITTGGGFGRIGFYDMRAQKYLDGFENGATKRHYLDIGSGWLNRETAYAGTISGITIRNAVYALEYDASGSRLFTAGGPLQLGLCGAYAGLWS